MFSQVAAVALHLALFAVPIWIALRVILAHRARGRHRSSLLHEMILGAALLYGIGLVAVTVYPLAALRGRGTDPGMNLIPLLSLSCLWPSAGDPPEIRVFCVENIAGNIALFVPVGVLGALLYRVQSFRRIAVYAAALSVAIEAAQFAEQSIGVHRAVDVDDVLFNTVGACLGFGLVMAFRRSKR